MTSSWGTSGGGARSPLDVHAEEAGPVIVKEGAGRGPRRNALVCSARCSGMWLFPSHLRTTLPLFRLHHCIVVRAPGRDFVKSATSSLVSIPANRWLMNADPLSEWKASRSEWNAPTSAPSTGTMK